MFITKSTVTTMNNKYACSAYYQQIVTQFNDSHIYRTSTLAITRYTISPVLP
ncbi:hypothetical protein B7P43_G15938 [Cryptotermes secundus]|uniref:Uncharacterized protein n=1 Tax=Cryptotermes secundus TaxID=105785 RepID=A0A2J7RTE5_9NEOP|nr:hypothetical protein B7P43_G15938 [Cryptotermes secundus]